MQLGLCLALMSHPSDSDDVVSLSRLARGYALYLGSFCALCLCALIVAWLSGLMRTDEIGALLSGAIDGEFLIYLAVGVIAQLVDGALGMAYGATATSFLMSAGVSPAIASAGVHISEVFTTAVSGVSHWRFGNVNFALFRRLAIPGALGAVVGAYALSSFDATSVRPFIAAYLMILGAVIIRKAFRKTPPNVEPPKHVAWLALFGGLVDASGGGGWGPIVTSTLLGSGHHPRTTIGTVNAAEFVVALAASSIFTAMLSVSNWQVVLGLIAGGALAAPLGAYICHRINVRAAMVAVGLLIIALSTRTVLKSLGIF